MEMEWHVNKTGLSNVLVQDLVRRMTRHNKHFLGVFAFDQIPIQKIIAAARKAASLRENVVTIINVGQHFVTVVIGPDSVLYIDSFAQEIPSKMKKFRALVSKLTMDGKRQLYVNKMRIQPFSSTHCGLYAALFTVWYLSPPRDRRKQSFHRDALKLNDDLCVQYLKHFILNSSIKPYNR